MVFEFKENVFLKIFAVIVYWSTEMYCEVCLLSIVLLFNHTSIVCFCTGYLDSILRKLKRNQWSKKWFFKLVIQKFVIEFLKILSQHLPAQT